MIETLRTLTDLIRSEADLTTDSISPFDILSPIVNCVKNMADWVMLKKAFGIQDVSDAFYGSTKYTLVQLLQDQLDNHVPLYFKVEEDNPPAGQRAWSYTSIFGGDLTLNVLNKFLQSRLRITI